MNPSRRHNMEVAIKNFGKYNSQIIPIDETGKENWKCQRCGGTICYDHDPSGEFSKLYCNNCGYEIWNQKKIKERIQ